jgi:predicted nucleic acid-binding protein
VASVLAEPEGYFQVLESTLAASKVIGSRIHDARIAAICTAHGVTVLWSVDRDFERFRGLRAENPLAA